MQPAPAEMVEVLTARDVGMVYNPDGPKPVRALGGISFGLRKREVLAIVGPSGCGKTTLFNIIAGLIVPSEGSVSVNGVQVAGANGQVGYMLQKDMLLPWRNVLDNVTLGLEVRGVARVEAEKIALRLIQAYGLAGFEKAKPSELSGGMRQRVAFMRTLAFDPDVILLDEPFSALDFQTRLLLQGEVQRIIRERGKSVILVTHDIGEAITMADRIVVMSNRPATVRSVHDIALSHGERDPVTIRTNPLYNEYFNLIWSELEIRRDI
ncbi:ABC transporter ATP-binding protein [Ferrovibrio sp.]|uniref:ABC transporter ATP-binding protein n=1 Tax=Ferrovibrio sp. TaxID=1917215 RepID=UPI001B62C90F|nr:ABC transporter ATP-binding protein [Ferrovibrio sp.]MBP7064838.1 ABC transporter ATP-binding protein [Ferrovibrio sp.]